MNHFLMVQALCLYQTGYEQPESIKTLLMQGFLFPDG